MILNNRVKVFGMAIVTLALIFFSLPKALTNPPYDVLFLKFKLYFNCDVENFKAIEHAYLDFDPRKTLTIIKFYADRSNMPLANYEVYSYIVGMQGWGKDNNHYDELDRCTDEERRQAVYYLKRAADAGYPYAMKVWATTLYMADMLLKIQ